MATDIETQNAYLSQHETTETEKSVTEEDWRNLRRVPGKLPMVALLILVVEVYLSSQVLQGASLTKTAR